MFCKWCGGKITNNGIPCPSCGKNQEALVNGNGFWDLCGINPKDCTHISAETVVSTQKNESVVQHEKGTNKDTGSKRCMSLSRVLHIATVFFLLIGIIKIGIVNSKTDECLSKMEALRIDVSNLNEHVNSGVEKMTEYHNVELQPVETRPSNDMESMENSVPLSIDDLLEKNKVLLYKNYKLGIEKHEIDSEYAQIVYISSGETLTEENIRIGWQKSVDAGATWQTISEGSSYVIVKKCEGVIYRVLYLIDSGATETNLCYYATTDELVDNTEPSGDGTLFNDTVETTDTTTSLQGDVSSNDAG